MPGIEYFDRYQQKLCIEKVYGDQYLRWTYGTLPGRIALAAAIKRTWFSKWYGWRMDQPASRDKIQPFIETYDVDASEFERAADEFATFNEFFYRRLKPEARPVDDDPATVAFPADGRHLCIPDLSSHDGLMVKGKMFNLRTLLQDDELADRYQNGALLLSRLCPVDYHRFHFPVGGMPGESQLINGPLYSVNPIALKQNISILATNKRTVCQLETEAFGKVLVLEIGATCVGGIVQTYAANQPVRKGDEKGYFRFGGSSTICIFEAGRIEFADDLVEHSSQHRELYARMGDQMARCCDE